MFRNQAFAIAGNYVGLATAIISDSTTVPTEVVDDYAYSRLTINAYPGSQPSWSTVSTGSVSNANPWTMPTPTNSWGYVVAAFISNSGTHGAGNVLLYDNDVVDKAVLVGDTIYWATGQFSLALD
jgi:hypothetical protein